MSRWFRHYAGMCRDEKLVSVAIKSKQPVERVVWVWGVILESAAEVNEDGRYELDAAEAAYFLRADQADMDAILSALEDAGRVAESVVVKWGNRQFSSDKSAARVAAHRERKRSERGRGNGKGDSCNNDVTLQKRRCNPPETETETEVDNKIEPKGSCASDDAHALKPEHFVEAWNTLADRLAKPKVRKLTPERRAALRARINGYTVDEFQEVLGNIERSPFLRGEKGWSGCTFDWITKKGNFQKILEGNYNG